MSSWKPAASMEQLKKRAETLSTIRQFFSARNVLEVETPLLSHFSVTDPHLDAFSLQQETLFLQTSPEYAMKRLLAAGSGPIYQISKAFRQGEQGSRHNVEFSMLEWYRPGFDHYQLMAEISDLLQVFFPAVQATTITYGEVFERALAIDPHAADAKALEVLARKHIDIQMQSDEKDDWLNLLMAECIEPTLGQQAPVFIVDYPASQAALAKIEANETGVEVAKRFELYFQGLELANGYHELTDPQEQQKRFNEDNALRTKLIKPHREGDVRLLAALESGLPDCAGVALGVDRLLMLIVDTKKISEVLSFPFDRA
jgi:lysyl-tRNA synthetase class 2